MSADYTVVQRRMGARRMISDNILKSNKFSQLSDKAKLIYLLTYTKTDDFGLLNSDAREIKTHISFIWDEITTDEVKKYIDEILKVNLWVEFEYKGKSCYRVVDFEKYQELRKDNQQPRSILDVSLVPVPRGTGQKERKDKYDANWRKIEEIIENALKEKGITVHYREFTANTQDVHSVSTAKAKLSKEKIIKAKPANAVDTADGLLAISDKETVWNKYSLKALKEKNVTDPEVIETIKQDYFDKGEYATEHAIKSFINSYLNYHPNTQEETNPLGIPTSAELRQKAIREGYQFKK